MAKTFTYSGRMKISRDDMALLKRGRKTVTVRLGTANVKGEEIDMTDGRESIRVRIIGVDTARTLGELTDQDAVNEGFNSREELLLDLKKYYPRAALSDRVTVISFALLSGQSSLF